MKKGQVVYNEWHGIRRYGIVEHTFTKEDSNLYIPWTYAKVKWFNDEAYENIVEQTNKLRNDGSDLYLREYRVDKLVQINLSKEIETLSKIRGYMEKEL